MKTHLPRNHFILAGILNRYATFIFFAFVVILDSPCSPAAANDLPDGVEMRELTHSNPLSEVTEKIYYRNGVCFFKISDVHHKMGNIKREKIYSFYDKGVLVLTIYGDSGKSIFSSNRPYRVWISKDSVSILSLDGSYFEEIGFTDMGGIRFLSAQELAIENQNHSEILDEYFKPVFVPPLK